MPIQWQQKSVVCGTVKKETAFSAVVQHGCDNRTAVEQANADTTRLWKQHGCGTALGPGWPLARQPCSAPLWETPSVFQLSLGDTAFTLQWELKVYPASHRRAGLYGSRRGTFSVRGL